MRSRPCGGRRGAIAGFGPIGKDPGATHDFWSGTLGIRFEELAPGYHHTEQVGGAKAFEVGLEVILRGLSR